MSRQSNSPRYDVVVVGARCAGAATAMLLARRGARVLLVDREPYGSDTMSTHALMRGAVMQLSNWGLMHTVAATGAPPIRTTSFIYGERPPLDIEISAQHGVSALYAPRRYALDKVLVDAARRSGVEVQHGVHCTDLMRNSSGEVCGVVLRTQGSDYLRIPAELVVGADGRNSTIARLAGAATIKRATNASRCIYGYFNGLQQEAFRWHWGEACGGGVIPTNEGGACVFIAFSSDDRETFRRALSPQGFAEVVTERMPQMAADISGGELTQRLTGFAGECGFLRQACGDGWALVGDAGYFKDPITAHGITDALRDAQILADSWAASDLDSYASTRDALSQDLFRISDTIAGYEWSMAELFQLHSDLNVAMKANQGWIADNLMNLAQAA